MNAVVEWSGIAVFVFGAIIYGCRVRDRVHGWV